MNGTNNSTVEFFKIVGGAHSWPGAINIGVVTNEDINASKEIWRFFSQHTLSPAAGINENSFQNNLVLYPNPANGNFTLVLTVVQAENMEINVLNSFGQLVSTDKYQFVSGTNKLAIDLTNKPKGIYFVQVKTSSSVLTKHVVVE